MLELTSHEVVCPVCKKTFFPETSVKGKVLCGEELYPRTKVLAKVMDCKIYYFCSKECLEKFQKEERKEKKVSRWNLLLEKISKANHAIEGLSTYELNKMQKSS